MVPTWIILLTILGAQMPSLIKDQKWAELAVFLVMWLGGALYATAVLMDVLPTNPTEIIMDIMNGITGMLTGD